jgi:hypothetical protein
MYALFCYLPSSFKYLEGLRKILRDPFERQMKNFRAGDIHRLPDTYTSSRAPTNHQQTHHHPHHHHADKDALLTDVDTFDTKKTPTIRASQHHPSDVQSVLVA